VNIKYVSEMSLIKNNVSVGSPFKC